MQCYNLRIEHRPRFSKKTKWGRELNGLPFYRRPRNTQIRRPLQPETLARSFCLEHSHSHVQRLIMTTRHLGLAFLFYSASKKDN